MITRSTSSVQVQYRGRTNTITLTLAKNGPRCGCTVPPYAPNFGYWTQPGSTIVYENSGGKRFNYCKHTKYNYTYLDDAPVTFGSDAVYKIRYGLDTGPLFPGTPPTVVVTEDMRRRAWDALHPEFGTGLSLINFLYELKDLPHLLRYAAKLLSALSTLPKLLRKLASTKTASELLLSWSFAIAPFMADVEKMLDAGKDLNRAFNDFAEAGRKPQTFHYREVGGDVVVSDTPTEFGHHVQKSRSSYYATLKCVYEYQRPTMLVLFRRYWGLRITPEALWNAVPFSFVIDWVAKVGDSLRMLDTDPNLRIVILDYCDTTKSEIWFEALRCSSVCTGCKSIGADFCQNDGKMLAKLVRSVYERTPTFPSTGVALPHLDEVSLRELVLGAALLR